MKKILVIGASGLLGSKIMALAGKNQKVIPTHHTLSLFPNSVKLDVTYKSETFQIIREIKPDVVIHTAAETNVDKCEIEKELAWNTNVEGTVNVADVCTKMNAKAVYISTDYVFDGQKGLYTEDDKPNPVNYYGFTKLNGEEFIRKLCRDYVIARTSVLYGWHPSKVNFATWIIESLRHGKTVNVVYDHYNSPTLADNMAQVLLEIVDMDLKGIYHIAGSQRISRYEFAVKIARNFGLDSNFIRPIKMEELKAWKARRPPDSSLCVDKVSKSLETKLLDIDRSLRLMKGTAEEFSQF